MTLVAGILIKGQPYVISDLLATSKDGGSPDDRIPTSINLTQFLSNTDLQKRRTLCRKLTIFKGRVCWAGSGDAEHLYEIYSHLTTYLKVHSADRHSLTRFFETMDLSQYHGEKIIGLVSDRDGAELFDWDGRVGKLTLGRECVIGSGKEDFLETRNSLVKEPQGTECDPVAVNLAGALIGEQIVTGQGLSQHWGGGLEIARSHDGFIQPLSKYAFVPIVLDKTGGPIISPQCILENFYLRNNLIVNVKWAAPSTAKVLREIFAVAPLLNSRRLTKRQLKTTIKTYSYICPIILMAGKKPTYVVVPISMEGNKNDYFRVGKMKKNNLFEIYIHERFIDLLRGIQLSMP